MGHRQISGLKWAREHAGRPEGIPVGRPRGAKRQGVKYERDLAKAIGSAAWHGKWFEFVDANGHGWCQPDFLMRVGENIVILEAKYTWVPEARGQVLQLYKPVVEATYGLRAVGVTVCKNLVSGMANCRVTGDLAEAIRWALTARGPEVVWQWLAGPAFGASAPSHVDAGAREALASL